MEDSVSGWKCHGVTYIASPLLEVEISTEGPDVRRRPGPPQIEDEIRA